MSVLSFTNAALQVPQLPAGIWLSASNPGSEDLVVCSAGGQSLQTVKLHRREKSRVFSVRFSFALGPSCGYVFCYWHEVCVCTHVGTFCERALIRPGTRALCCIL